MSKYSVGDRVRVRSDLTSGTWYGSNNATGSMCDWKGKVVTIKDFYGEDGCYIMESGFGWTDDMFVGLANDESDNKEITY